MYPKIISGLCPKAPPIQLKKLSKGFESNLLYQLVTDKFRGFVAGILMPQTSTDSGACQRSPPIAHYKIFPAQASCQNAKCDQTVVN